MTMMTKELMQKPQMHLGNRQGYCPTCEQQSEFTFLGEQRWPPHVAAKLGLSPVVILWSCNNCHTTLTEAQDEA